MIRTHGHFCWNELLTRDVERSKRFYADTIGWTFESMQLPDGGTYWIGKLGDEPVCVRVREPRGVSEPCESGLHLVQACDPRFGSDEQGDERSSLPALCVPEQPRAIRSRRGEGLHVADDRLGRRDLLAEVHGEGDDTDVGVGGQ